MRRNWTKLFSNVFLLLASLAMLWVFATGFLGLIRLGFRASLERLGYLQIACVVLLSFVLGFVAFHLFLNCLERKFFPHLASKEIPPEEVLQMVKEFPLSKKNEESSMEKELENAKLVMNSPDDEMLPSLEHISQLSKSKLARDVFAAAAALRNLTKIGRILGNFQSTAGLRFRSKRQGKAPK